MRIHNLGRCFAGTILAIAVTAPLSAQDAPAKEDLATTARVFGVRASVLDISLSPSGSKLAYISAGPDHIEVVNIIDLEGDASPRMIIANREKEVDLDWCEWATDSRLVCQVSGMARGSTGVLLPFDRLLAVNDDGSNVRELSTRQSANAVQALQFGGDVIALDAGGAQGQILMTRQYVPESNPATRLYSDKSGFGVDLVDVTTAKRQSREGADELAVHYVADESGWVRVKVRALRDGNNRLTGNYAYFYRAPGSNDWLKFENLTIDGAAVPGFSPVAVDSSRNVAYGFITQSGYDAIAEFALDGSGTGKILMARGDVDVDALIRIGRKRRVVGASYATEKREIAYFDADLSKLAKALAKALPDQPLINIVGASGDESRLLMIASSDTQPGMTYLFNKTNRQLEPLMPVRAPLADRPMGKMSPVSFPARDGTMIPGYLTLPPGSEGKGLPAVVLPHGGPAARDEWGFDWLVQFLTARGFAVLQPNYRGSSGYGEAWYGRNGFKAWDVAIGDVNDAGRWLVSQGIAKPDQLAIAGWSYGGYAALQSQVLDPALYKAVVAIAPVTDLGYIVEDARDYTNARVVREYIGQGPHVEAGSPRRHADKFAAPVVLFHGTLDINVEVRHSRGMESALRGAGKQVLYREYPDLQHDLGDSKVRVDMLTDIGRFLDQSLGRN
ncbi:alpha/beta hydrolase family protein [Porphyrobacter sp. LM 6]|uniref:alpha/beta hydrolase family protein n=1 Tax=Porphyrobacter sp. LM 6 TaxID=1896196 RepID=UPI00084688D6|nr:alpha/beta fold hydrolase [Porphyrobacter sp. LM 6]AOL94763.1 Dipeptidyl aminopeptidase/acylaminoacyl peptidase [Porphyrobacter sp. LM 6]